MKRKRDASDADGSKRQGRRFESKDSRRWDPYNNRLQKRIEEGKRRQCERRSELRRYEQMELDTKKK